MKKVSIVIPIYNTERYLPECLNSVISQTYRDLEIICVDDGSTDATAVILQQYAKTDSRIKILTQENAGPGAARNAGMNQATGEYIVFLDSDDWFEPSFIHRMLQRTIESSSDITICRSTQFDSATGSELPSLWMLNTQFASDAVFSPAQIPDYIFQLTYGWPWDKLYRSDFIKSFSFPDLSNSEDLVFVYTSLVSAHRIAILDESMVHHRINREHSISASREADPEAPYVAACLLKKFLLKDNLWNLYERSFTSWVVQFLVWHVSDLKETNTRRRLYNLLQKQWLRELGCMDHKASYYEQRGIRYKYLLVKYSPYWGFTMATLSNKILKKQTTHL